MKNKIKIVDACLKPCPLPVVETKKAIEKNPGREIEVIVDNEAAKINVQKFAHSRSYKSKEEGMGANKTALFLSPEAGAHPQESAVKQQENSPDAGTVFFIRSKMLGRPDRDLGELLMRTFFQEAKDISPLPEKIVLMHGGVKLAVEGSSSLEALLELEEKGVDIVVCGTCLDYYELKGNLKAGRVSDFFEIASVLNSASNTVTL